jgi:predicted nuclease of predicted toxin-antitoxin system
VTDDASGTAERPRLVLDEMHAPVLAQRLRERGHDVVSVAEDSGLRAMTDDEVYNWAAEEQRRIVTENVKDFRRILVRAQQAGGPTAAVLFTSSRVFPRARRNPAPLIAALDAWLRSPDVCHRNDEDWLRPS